MSVLDNGPRRAPKMYLKLNQCKYVNCLSFHHVIIVDELAL